MAMAGSAISKFVEWVGFAVVNKHVSTGYSYLRDRILSYNREAKLKRLKTALPQIKAVMGVAEALKVKDPNTSEWVQQFRQAVEASQIVLNELEYKNQDEAGGSASSSKKRKRCTINDGTSKRLKDAVTMLDRATTEIDHLLRLATALGVHGLSESRQDINKILRQEINLCLAEREVLGCRNLFVNLPHLKLSYLEIDHLCLSPMVSSLTSLRVLTIESCQGSTPYPRYRERHEIGESSHSNESITMDVD
ncbi:putative disease resistance protein RGA3 [Carex littledalei]|uniref:Putative disease resistance protein RGA3 n=1 Tax=Carex littledalei TaxID=544730 RepID=A0A833R655_9POAL|nr:putative disease resistance protein RGA3 [Carex littledalei]